VTLADEIEVGPVSELKPARSVGAGRYAVGKANDEYFAVTRTCRHMFADLAGGAVDKEGCLICPRHGSRYDVKTGRMVRGPRGIYGRVPGLGTFFKALTMVWPLGRGEVTEREGVLYVK
jgi:nitrite reductase/ring-hydroxylating ferredoxin subunit